MKSKVIKIVIAVVLLGAAGYLLYNTFSGGSANKNVPKELRGQ